MVKIKLDRGFEDWYVTEIREHFRGKDNDNYEEIDDIVQSRLCMTFKELLILKPNELIKITTKIYSIDYKDLFEGLYKSFRSSTSSKKFIEKLNLKTCPYCNRNYIHNFKRKRSKEATAQLDHFYDKSQYPYLALSMYNLVPSCSTCNLRKSASDVVKEPIFNPYLDNLDNHAEFTSLGILSVDELKEQNLSFFSEERMNLELKKTTSDTRTDKHIESFNIKSLYECHKDIVTELYQKRIIYSEEYIAELIKDFEGEVFKDRNELLQLITCSSIKKDEIHKRPLSKLKRDIAKELKFI